ncbi:MAG: hypothetical protein WD044_13955 [Dongiaceae bacterium]
MPARKYGSLTKEFPLDKVHKTISAITPGMNYQDLLEFARNNTEPAIPGLLKKRWLLIDHHDRIVYDEFLSLVNAVGVTHSIIHKVMLFTWAYRDDRIRRFILERVARPNGKWVPQQLLNKNNADFFEQGKAKARSNFERFLVETHIFNPKTQTINLNLSDQWLEIAARVVAQHESNREQRSQLLHNPYLFLVDQKWTGLANATSDELLQRRPLIVRDADPAEDDGIERSSPKEHASKVWFRDPPKVSGKPPKIVIVNQVLLERANRTHYEIEKLLTDVISELGHSPRHNNNIDVFFSSAMGSAIIEVKSCNEGNFHSQVRRGISQLLEYRYTYRDILTAPIHLALAFETRPSPDKAWLIEYLNSLNISIAWIDKSAKRLRCQGPVPPILEGIWFESIK